MSAAESFAFDATNHKGIIYAYGGGDAGFSNPVSGLIAATYSTMDLGSDSVASLTDRTGGTVGFYTTNSAGGWVKWAFPNPVELTGWALQQRPSGGNLVRACKIQGSNDDSTWTDLWSGTLAAAAANWDDTTTGVTGGSYRYIRVINDGLDSSGQRYLCFQEIEFFGTKF